MKLIDRQIKATKETLRMVLDDFKRGLEYHRWIAPICPLCHISPRGVDNCEGCPLRNERPLFGCLELMRKDYVVTNLVPSEGLAGFLQSLLITLELMKEGK